MRNPVDRKATSLFSWIWQSFLKTALIPLVIIELSFLIIYFTANQWSQSVTIDYISQDSQAHLIELAKQQTDKIQEQLTSVETATDFYRQQAARALTQKHELSAEDAARLTYSKDGAYYTTRDKQNGGVAIFYSGAIPVGELERQKVSDVLSLENTMKDLFQANPLVASLYFNSFDSLNIIYPYFDVISQYMTHMDIPTFNFYYEADLAHNPERKVQWTDVYLDPAGHGWMASAIAPVYNQADFLEGVVGMDITVDTITKDILNLDIPWGGYGVLLSKDGTILALPPAGEKDWGLQEITDHHYSEAILQDTFKPEAFNLYRRQNLAALAEQVSKSTSGYSNVKLGGTAQIVSWSTIQKTGWNLLIIVPEKSITAPIVQIQTRLFMIGLYMVVLLVSFYAIFFYFLYLRSKTLSQKLSEPLLEINEAVKQIGAGSFNQDLPAFKVSEFNESAANIIKMGRQLGEATGKILEAQKKRRDRQQFEKRIYRQYVT